ncbi:MAG: MBL fold metallo-hydrolase [Planctomycetes bacterium]|nr:MBL fold metallo-hydrolase [Planctomycetota bacterium]
MDPILEQIGPAACRSYLVACPRAREAVVIDALAEDVPATLARLERGGLRLVAAIDTHTHADHLSGGAALAAATGGTYALHEATECATVRDRLRDGQVVEAGDVRLEILHTPGHTPDSASIRCGRLLFTGDFLFLAQDGAGRLDLPGSDAGVHWDSLQRLASLGGESVVLPGHDYEGFGASTLDEERRRNPRFQDLSRVEYVAWQRAIAMQTPDWMLAVIAANLGTAAEHASHHADHGAKSSAAADIAGLSQACPPGGGGACQAGPMGRVPTIFIDEAARRVGRVAADRPFLLDVREPHEFSGPRGRHAPGAVLVPLAQLPHRLDALPDDLSAEILVICKSGGRSARAAEFLIESGRRRVFNIAGGTDAWAGAGLPVER